MTNDLPALYQTTYVKEARDLCSRGAGESDLARHFKCSIWDIRLWKAVHKDFAAAVKVGADCADDKVTMSLYERACGCEVEEIREAPGKDGSIRKTITRRWIPGDPGAAQYWLENRRPDLWQNRVAIDHTVSNADVRDISTAELLRIARSGSAGDTKPASGAGKPDRVH